MSGSEYDKREKIFSSGDHDADWPNCGPITDLIDWLQKQRDLAPEEYRQDVKIDISADFYWLTADVYYYRPELPNETQERIARERGEAKRIEAKERAKLAALKRKYER